MDQDQFHSNTQTLDSMEAAQLLGVNRTRLSQLTSKGVFQVERRRIGHHNRLFYKKEELLSYLEQRYSHTMVHHRHAIPSARPIREDDGVPWDGDNSTTPGEHAPSKVALENPWNRPNYPFAIKQFEISAWETVQERERERLEKAEKGQSMQSLLNDMQNTLLEHQDRLVVALTEKIEHLENLLNSQGRRWQYGFESVATGSHIQKVPMANAWEIKERIHTSQKSLKNRVFIQNIGNYY